MNLSILVVDAYRDVSRAGAERQRRINEGQTYRVGRLAQTQGVAAITLNRAEAGRHGQSSRASGGAFAFHLRIDARAPFPGLTDHQLYIGKNSARSRPVNPRSCTTFRKPGAATWSCPTPPLGINTPALRIVVSVRLR